MTTFVWVSATASRRVTCVKVPRGLCHPSDQSVSSSCSADSPVSLIACGPFVSTGLCVGGSDRVCVRARVLARVCASGMVCVCVTYAAVLVWGSNPAICPLCLPPSSHVTRKTSHNHYKRNVKRHTQRKEAFNRETEGHRSLDAFSVMPPCLHTPLLQALINHHPLRRLFLRVNLSEARYELKRIF